jgi:5-methyltetrahydropteroyltriglutamate--homocysteine methyltransferase
MSPPLYRADHTGSYLRPKDLAAARKKFKEGEISAAELRKVEDVWIEDLVKKLHS